MTLSLSRPYEEGLLHTFRAEDAVVQRQLRWRDSSLPVFTLQRRGTNCRNDASSLTTEFLYHSKLLPSIQMRMLDSTMSKLVLGMFRYWVLSVKARLVFLLFSHSKAKQFQLHGTWNEKYCSSKQTLYKIAVFKVVGSNTSYTACREYKTKNMLSYQYTDCQL